MSSPSPTDGCETKFGLTHNNQVSLSSDGCVCNVCGKSLKALWSFRRHACIPQSKDKQMLIERENGHYCQHCGKLFSSLSDFKVHENKHAMRACDLCYRHFLDEISLIRHNQLEHCKPKLCKSHCLMCGFSTTNLQYLKRHLKSHLGTKPYSCQMCDKCFEWKCYLNAHVKTVHENTRPYSCEICAKKFKQKTSLSLHKKSQHTGEKPFSCFKCPKAFVRANSLRDHIKSHLLVKKPQKHYCCNLCNNRTFLDKTCLAVHMASAHSADKPYMCDVCGKGFKLKNCLRVHTQVHSEERPYYCQLCDGAFKSKKDLKKHQERHKSSMDHVCDTCGKRFLTRNDVYIHQQVHDPSKHHRIYRPGMYEVSGGELVTARTRKNKLSLKEQEPISFDTEINGTGSLKLKISQEKESHASSDRVLSSVPRGMSSACLGNEALSSESLLSFETFLDTSDDSNEFPDLNPLESVSDAKSPVDKYVSNSSDSTTDFSAKPSAREVETHERWNSVELLEDYDWLDTSSPQDNALVKSSAPLEGSVSSVHIEGSQIMGSHAPIHRDVNSDDSQSIDGIHSLRSSLHEFPDFDDQEVANKNDEEGDVTHCDSDVDLRSLNEYLIEELNTSQNLTPVNQDDFNSSLHSADNKRSNSEEIQESSSSSGNTLERGGVRTLNRQTSDLGNSSRSDIRSTLKNEGLVFYGEGVLERLPRNGRQFVLKCDDNPLSAGQLEVKGQDKRLLIDFHMTSCDMFNDTNDIFEENNALDARHVMGISQKHDISQNAGNFYMDESSSDDDHLTGVETDDHLTEIEMDDHLTEAETKDHLTEAETDHLTAREKRDHMVERESHCQTHENETQDCINEFILDDEFTDWQKEYHITKRETECHIIERETEDWKQSHEEIEYQQVMKEVEQCRMMTTSLKHRQKYKLMELVSGLEEFSHGIVRARKQRKLTPSWKCSTCAATLSSRVGWKLHQQSCKISSADGTKRFRCEDCQRSYTTQSNLNTHWAACHAGDGQSFVCHMCGHTCNDKQNLRNHLVRHSSARPFKCDLCQKCFKTRADIRVHLNKHLPLKMLFKCDLCHQFYNHFNSLQVHKQTHLSVVPLFTCNICGRQLSDRSNLTAHTRRHLVPRKYQCPICSKELSSSHSLQGHQGSACLKYQLKTLKTREKRERCLVKGRAKEESGWLREELKRKVFG